VTNVKQDVEFLLRDRPIIRSDDGLIEISAAMTAAGVECIRELRYGEDIRHVVQSVYMAMEYEKRYPRDSAPPLLQSDLLSG
jgi:hypothetical protein